MAHLSFRELVLPMPPERSVTYVFGPDTYLKGKSVNYVSGTFCNMMCPGRTNKNGTLGGIRTPDTRLRTAIEPRTVLYRQNF